MFKKQYNLKKVKASLKNFLYSSFERIYVVLIIVLVFLLILAFKYGSGDFIIFIPIILIFGYLLRNNKSLYSSFLIILLASCLGVLFAEHITTLDRKLVEKDKVKKLLDIGNRDVIFKYTEIRKMNSGFESNNIKDSLINKNLRVRFPSIFYRIINKQLSHDYISYHSMALFIGIKKNLLHLYNSSKDTLITDIELKKSYLFAYEFLLGILFQATISELSYLNEEISTDSLLSSSTSIRSRMKFYFKD